MQQQQKKKYIEVFGCNMAYVDVGCGERTFVFLHGNP